METLKALRKTTLRYPISSSDIRPYQVLLLWARVDLGVIAIMRYSASSKAPALLDCLVWFGLVWFDSISTLVCQAALCYITAIKTKIKTLTTK